MGFYFPIIFLPAFLVALICKFFWPHKITGKEWLLQFAGVIVSTLLCIGIISASSFGYTSDNAIFNGEVTGKDKVEVSCSHQYVCGQTCVPVTTKVGKTTTTTMSCSPKYCDEHSYDVDWDVYTTLGTYTIDRVDRRGLKMPARWDLVNKGDPVADDRTVQNYMLLDQHRFDTSATIREQYKGRLPEYPRIFNYYMVHRVLAPTGKEYKAISDWLSLQLRKDGPAKQLNVILVVTRNDANYFYALMEHWKGVRKNDVVIVYGIDNEDNISWSRAMSWADGQNNQVMLKQLQTMTYERKFGQSLVEEQYELIVKEFKRVPNKQFEYLRAGWEPPMWIIVMMVLFNLVGAIAAAWFVIKEDVI